MKFSDYCKFWYNVKNKNDRNMVVFYYIYKVFNNHRLPCKHLDIEKLMLSKGGYLDSTIGDILYKASSFGYIDIVHLMLEFKRKQNDDHIYDNIMINVSCMFAPYNKSHVEIIKLMIDHGATSWGAVNNATKNGCKDIVLLLLKYDIKNKGYIYGSKRTSVYNDILYYASVYGHIDILHIIIEYIEADKEKNIKDLNLTITESIIFIVNTSISDIKYLNIIELLIKYIKKLNKDNL